MNVATTCFKSFRGCDGVSSRVGPVEKQSIAGARIELSQIHRAERRSEIPSRRRYIRSYTNHQNCEKPRTFRDRSARLDCRCMVRTAAIGAEFLRLFQKYTGS